MFVCYIVFDTSTTLERISPAPLNKYHKCSIQIKLNMSKKEEFHPLCPEQAPA